MGTYREVFELAAKLGSLEGYVYERPDPAERSNFPNWLGNIQRMYAALPPGVQADFREQYREVLGKVAGHLEKLAGPQDSNLLQARRMLAEASDR